jgi:hypothetical protein
MDGIPTNGTSDCNVREEPKRKQTMNNIDCLLQVKTHTLEVEAGGIGDGLWK